MFSGEFAPSSDLLLNDVQRAADQLLTAFSGPLAMQRAAVDAFDNCLSVLSVEHAREYTEFVEAVQRSGDDGFNPDKVFSELLVMDRKIEPAWSIGFEKPMYSSPPFERVSGYLLRTVQEGIPGLSGWAASIIARYGYEGAGAAEQLCGLVEDKLEDEINGPAYVRAAYELGGFCSEPVRELIVKCLMTEGMPRAVQYEAEQIALAHRGLNAGCISSLDLPDRKPVPREVSVADSELVTDATHVEKIHMVRSASTAMIAGLMNEETHSATVAALTEVAKSLIEEPRKDLHRTLTVNLGDLVLDYPEFVPLSIDFVEGLHDREYVGAAAGSVHCEFNTTGSDQIRLPHAMPELRLVTEGLKVGIAHDFIDRGFYLASIFGRYGRAGGSAMDYLTSLYDAQKNNCSLMGGVISSLYSIGTMGDERVRRVVEDAISVDEFSVCPHARKLSEGLLERYSGLLP